MTDTTADARIGAPIDGPTTRAAARQARDAERARARGLRGPLLSRLVPRGGALWLLLNDLRGRFRSGGQAPVSPALRWVGLAMMAGLVVASGALGSFLLTLAVEYFGFRGAAEVGGDLPGEALAWLTIGLFWLFLLTLSGTIGGVTSLLAERSDFDLLLTAPIAPRAILLTRVAGVAVTAALLPLVLTLPGALVWLVQTGEAWPMAMPVTTLALAVMAAAIGLLLTMAVSRLVGPKRARVGAQVLGLMVGAFLFLLTQPGTRELFGLDRLVDAMARFADANPLSPAFMPAQASLGLPLALVAVCVVSAALLAIAAQTFARRLAADAAAFSMPESGRAASAGQMARAVAGIRGGLVGAMRRKSWRTMLRDPLFITSVLYGTIFFIPLLVLFFRDGFDDPERIATVGAGLAVWLVGLNAPRIALAMTTLERGHELVATAPISQRRHDLSLVWSIMSLGLLLAAVLALPFALVSVASAVGVLAFSAISLLSLALSAVRWPGVRAGSQAGRPYFRRPFTASLTDGVTAIMWSFVASLTLSGSVLAILPAIPALWVLAWLRVDVAERGRRRAAVTLEPEAPVPDQRPRRPGLLDRFRRRRPAVA
jgi:ABC-2 type transport system permease protein